MKITKCILHLLLFTLCITNVYADIKFTEDPKKGLHISTDNSWAFDSNTKLDVGDIAPASKGDGEIEYIGDIAARIEAGENLDDIRAANQSWGERNKTVIAVVIISLIFFLGIIYFDKSKK